MRCSFLLLALFFCGQVTAQGAERNQPLRDQVLKADTASKAGKAYEAYFVNIGPAGLRDLLDDNDIGIALHSAWEVHKKEVDREKPRPKGLDDVYDRNELRKFLGFLVERTKAPIPDWWAAGIADIHYNPGIGLVSGDDYVKGWPDLKKTAYGKSVQRDATLQLENGRFRISTGEHTIDFPKSTFDDLSSDSFAVLFSAKRAIVAAYSTAGGFEYQLASFESRGGKLAWKTEVWAAGRTVLAGEGAHRMALAEKNGVVFVFGAESHGMYLEAFDSLTGKCLYRFCNGYWFHFSERWKW